MGRLPMPQLSHASAMNRVSVIVPVYNEEESVPILQRELVDALQGTDYEIIFVDDGSSDQTAARIATDPHVRVLRFEENAGQSAAVWAGLLGLQPPETGATVVATSGGTITFGTAGDRPPHGPTGIDLVASDSSSRNTETTIAGVRFRLV